MSRAAKNTLYVYICIFSLATNHTRECGVRKMYTIYIYVDVYIYIYIYFVSVVSFA